MELWLLVEESTEDVSGGLLFSIAGRSLRLSHFPPNSNCPDYVCVSYVWGSQRVPNLWGSGPPQISSNTIPALSAALSSSNAKAFWIDAFCIPTAQPAKRRTLESLGFIFSQATEIRVALSVHSLDAIKQLASSDQLDEIALNTLEQDAWINSVWTYQEVINSKNLHFVCFDLPGVLVDGSQFLNGVGYSLELYKKLNGLDSFDVAERFPNLDTLQDLIADWLCFDYVKSSALAVMSNVDRRTWTNDDNYFFAMIGAISATPSDRSSRSTPHLSETLMDICDAKNDYSYIFSSAARAEAPYPPWRPTPGLLPSIIRWHCWGESQRGHYDQDAFWLDDVALLSPAPLRASSKEHGASWISKKYLATGGEDEIAHQIHAILVRMGFTGSPLYVGLAEGFFFPQTPLPPLADIQVLVSMTIHWTFGSPAIARTQQREQWIYIPGVFSGRLDTTAGTSVQLQS